MAKQKFNIIKLKAMQNKKNKAIMKNQVLIKLNNQTNLKGLIQILSQKMILINTKSKMKSFKTKIRFQQLLNFL